jgi:hypothetical protein
MTPEHQAHLDRLLSEVHTRLKAKYIKGQNEHGGKLWEKPGLLDEAINEAIDQVVYLMTLKEQLSE